MGILCCLLLTMNTLLKWAYNKTKYLRKRQIYCHLPWPFTLTLLDVHMFYSKKFILKCIFFAAVGQCKGIGRYRKKIWVFSVLDICNIFQIFHRFVFRLVMVLKVKNKTKVIQNIAATSTLMLSRAIVSFRYILFSKCVCCRGFIIWIWKIVNCRDAVSLFCLFGV